MRKIITIILISMLAIVFVGCRNDKPKTNQNNQQLTIEDNKNITDNNTDIDISIPKTADTCTTIAKFSTSYSTSSTNRCHNIELAVSRINGKVIAPYEKFSYNDTILTRTLDNGYLSATIISNGSYSQGVGGGVCQVSSTLYNACLLADLEIVSRVGHSLPPNYLPLGQDAMVSFAQDFEFINNSTSNITINARTIDKVIYIELVGSPLPYTIEIKSTIEKEIPFETEYINTDIEEDDNRVIIEGKTGYQTILIANYTHIEDGITITESKEISRTYYKPHKQVTAKYVPPINGNETS